MKYISLLTCVLLIYGCKKTPMPDGNIMPPPLNFVLLDKQGNNLLVNTSTPIRVSWVNTNGQTSYLGDECASGECTMVRASYSATGTPKYAFHYMSLGASLVSASVSKTFYIELNGKTDTLFYDVQKTRPNDPLDKYDVKSVVFNGEEAPMDPTQLPIYVFRRKH